MASISVVCTVMCTIISTRHGQGHAGFVAPAAITTETLKDVSTHMQRRQMLCITYQAPFKAETALIDMQAAQLSAENKLLDSQTFELAATHAVAEPTLRCVFEVPAAFPIEPFTCPEMPHVNVQALRPFLREPFLSSTLAPVLTCRARVQALRRVFEATDTQTNNRRKRVDNVIYLAISAIAQVCAARDRMETLCGRMALSRG
ncbi:hypothetical protein BX661DRAFT_197059 [Kickxella alabastrina]|uniref:uncharacterized protein n=1 Tax=Kickxella alabastrina TaxID=61397 RepID=UPI00221E4804|nr:uncharacterized protein BX661DRAFT_197059 [Kickxella alabastrina]KAI7833199.1 hypothetical protein BX661DRAFT_197059 [Kickxella alabastrina]